MEGRPMVSSATGAMNSLLDKFPSLLDKLPELESMRQDLESLRHDVLEKFAGRGVIRGAKIKEWMEQVREVVYDMEDWIDLCIHPSKPDKPEPATNFGWSDDIAEQIEEFKAQIKEAQDRCTRYGLLDKLPTSDADLADHGVPRKVTIDPKLLHGEESGLVALDDPTKQLVNHLMGEDQALKVVSVLGVGGLGKTTLAKEVYRRQQQSGFECLRAFVYVGRNPSIKTTLINILHQVIPLMQGNTESWGEQRIVAELWGFLGTKRYFIVLDDIWTIRDWKVISCAFPDKDLGSRILTTTCIMNVAKSCSLHPRDVIYRMEALSENYSRSLFRSRISVQEKERPGDFNEVADDMLRKCGGVPLAIIVAAGLLDRKSAELGPSKKLQESIYPALDQYSTLQGIRKLLDMCYADLSLPLKSCFMYFSAFPENYTIKKDRSIGIWIAEGFIPKRYEESLWETGESYFNEFISRRLIQPVFDYDNVQAVGCTVHGVILDYISSLSSEDNFVTTGVELRSGPFPRDTIRRFSFDCSNKDEDQNQDEEFLDFMASTTGAELRSGPFPRDTIRRFSSNKDKDENEDKEFLDFKASTTGAELRSGPFPRDTIRRFLFDCSNKDEDNSRLTASSTVQLSRVRSLTFLGNIKRMPGEILHLRFLRVLDLEVAYYLPSHHLKGIAGLVLLRYLGIGGRGIHELPEEIGELQHLETLDLRRTTHLTILPASIAGLRKLVRLLLSGRVQVPKEIRKMQELEEVSTIGVHANSSLNSLSELLIMSKRLRMLGVSWGGYCYDRQSAESFLNEVGNSSLQSLLLQDFPSGESLDILLDSRVPLHHFRRFELTISDTLFRGVPPKMASLINLTHLHIEIRRVETEDLGVLRALHNLILLDLHSEYSRLERPIIIRDGFPCLVVFSYTCRLPPGNRLQFTPGAMPQLRRLRFVVNARVHLEDYDFGIQHLSCLTRVHATINCWEATDLESDAAEAAIREQVSKNPNSPVLDVEKIRKYMV